MNVFIEFIGAFFPEYIFVFQMLEGLEADAPQKAHHFRVE
jgi:hypothetical protein